MNAVGIKTGSSATDLKKGDLLQYKHLGIFSIETAPKIVGTKVQFSMMGDVGGAVNVSLGASDWVIFYRS